MAMSAKEYAEYRGVSKALISRYCTQGRLKGAARKRKGRWYIDPKKADHLISAARDPAQPKKPTRKRTPNQAEKEKTALAGGTNKMDFAEARTWNERYKAALRKLDYDQKIARLVDAKEVEIAAFNMARRVRDALENIPDRFGPELATEQDSDKITQTLRAAIREALEELSKDD